MGPMFSFFSNINYRKPNSFLLTRKLGRYCSLDSETSQYLTRSREPVGLIFQFKSIQSLGYPPQNCGSRLQGRGSQTFLVTEPFHIIYKVAEPFLNSSKTKSSYSNQQSCLCIQFQFNIASKICKIQKNIYQRQQKRKYWKNMFFHSYIYLTKQFICLLTVR